LLYNVGKAAGDLTNTPAGGGNGDAGSFSEDAGITQYDLRTDPGLRNYIIAHSTTGDPLSADGATA